MEPVVALIGMDWADQEHAIHLYDVNTNTVENRTVSQKPEDLHQWIRALQARYKGARIAVALEQSRGPLIYALMRYDFFLIYPLNPKALACYRNALRTSGAKDDPTDAELILNFLRTHRDKLRVWVPEDQISRQLTILVEFRRKIVADIIAVTNRLTALLKSYSAGLGNGRRAGHHHGLRFPSQMADPASPQEDSRIDPQKVLLETQFPFDSENGIQNGFA